MLAYFLNDFNLSKKIDLGETTQPLMISVHTGLNARRGLPVELNMDANKFNMDLVRGTVSQL